MLNAALFAIIEDAASKVLILTEDADKDAVLTSRLTCTEVQQKLRIIAVSRLRPACCTTMRPDHDSGFHSWNTLSRLPRWLRFR